VQEAAFLLRRWRVPLGAVFAGVLACLLLAGPVRGAAPVGFVGSAACADCHAEAFSAWRGSHHDLAMQEATADSVLGDFDNREFAHFGLTTRFFRDGERFMVHTDGPDGALADFEIRYTFGYYPLQQYLVDLGQGRLQALDIAWDSRSADAGGQRWFHLHPDEPIDHDDVLHWTGPNLNWNYMCADCHSTNLKKGYDAVRREYRTTWSGIDVGCEACHGPGAAHVAWAGDWSPGADVPSGDNGLGVVFDERKGISWGIAADGRKVERSRPRVGDKEISVCARCHSRRGQLDDDMVPGAAFMDHYRPSLLTPGLYHVDGQIQDEVYVWGSFLQSRMYQAGVTCSDCHEPHSGELRQPGSLVCAQCHDNARYASRTHHFHDPSGAGGDCIACHMPATTYMQVDDRSDHSMRVPRPDLSVVLDTPNACTQCHRDRDDPWAAEAVQGWFGRPARGLQDYAMALDGGRRAHPAARPALSALVNDATQPAIARATALALLGNYPDRQTLMQLQMALSGDDPLLLLGALDGLSTVGQAQQLAIPLLWNDNRSVRTAAARLLTGVADEQLPEGVMARLADARREYRAAREFNAERPEAQLALAALDLATGQPVAAEQRYREALRLQPQFVPAYVNFAQMLAGLGREREAENLLRAGLGRMPEQATLAHALGLSLVRQQRLEEALEWLGRAARHDPGQARFSYVYGVALHSAGRVDQALVVLGEAYRRHEGSMEILAALVSMNREAGHPEVARDYAKRLRALQAAAAPSSHNPG
jgi:predicted CXXCH cytochrome family protein